MIINYYLINIERNAIIQENFIRTLFQLLIIMCLYTYTGRSFHLNTRERISLSNLPMNRLRPPQAAKFIWLKIVKNGASC